MDDRTNEVIKMDKELIRKCVTYLSIIESMVLIDNEWYQQVFKNHPDWKQGLSQTIEELEQLQEKKVIG